MYSPIAEASIKDLEIKDNKAIVHTEKSYKENKITFKRGDTVN